MDLHTSWVTEEAREGLIKQLSRKVDLLQKRLEMLEAGHTCGKCHYGQNTTYCKHSARNWPFDNLKLQPGPVDCAYFSLPYCEICGSEELPVTDYDGYPFCPVCKCT